MEEPLVTLVRICAWKTRSYEGSQDELLFQVEWRRSNTRKFNTWERAEDLQFIFCSQYPDPSMADYLRSVLSEAQQSGVGKSYNEALYSLFASRPVNLFKFKRERSAENRPPEKRKEKEKERENNEKRDGREKRGRKEERAGILKRLVEAHFGDWLKKIGRAHV